MLLINKGVPATEFLIGTRKGRRESRLRRTVVAYAESDAVEFLKEVKQSRTALDEARCEFHIKRARSIPSFVETLTQKGGRGKKNLSGKLIF